MISLFLYAPVFFYVTDDIQYVPHDRIVPFLWLPMAVEIPQLYEVRKM